MPIFSREAYLQKRLGTATLNYAGAIRARVSSAFELDGVEHTHTAVRKNNVFLQAQPLEGSGDLLQT